MGEGGEGGGGGLGLRYCISLNFTANMILNPDIRWNHGATGSYSVVRGYLVQCETIWEDGEEKEARIISLSFLLFIYLILFCFFYYHFYSTHDKLQ